LKGCAADRIRLLRSHLTLGTQTGFPPRPKASENRSHLAPRLPEELPYPRLYNFDIKPARVLGYGDVRAPNDRLVPLKDFKVSQEDAKGLLGIQR
jgi:hypothetical protein